MRIFVDMDGVTCDMLTPMLDIYNKKYNEAVPIEAITSWDLPKSMVNIFMNTEGFFRELPPIEGAIESIRYLSKKYQIIFATDPSGSPEIARDKMLWLKLMSLNYPVIITPNKSWLNGYMLIDDAPHHIKNFVDAAMVTKGLLFDAPYNQDVEETKRIKRVEGWHDIVYKIETLGKEW